MKVCASCKTTYLGGEIFCPNDGARLAVAGAPIGANGNTDPLIGHVLSGRYEVVERIGEGGMGFVYRCTHVDLKRPIAIKVLRPDFSHRPDVVARFQREARSASRIGHEHIVDVLDFGETPTGQSYFAMEYLEGEDLAEVLARTGTISAARACGLLGQCARALAAAHDKGIVHRDMKPENIFLVYRDGREFVKIVDFGIAKMSDIEVDGAPGRKLTKTGSIFGTPEYMSPEQASGKELDHRVDIYALGIILFECIAGRVPFVGDTFMGILTKQLFDPMPDLLEVNPHAERFPGVDMILRRGLAKDRDHRYLTMHEFADALEAIARGELPPEETAAMSTRPPPPPRVSNSPSVPSISAAPIPLSITTGARPSLDLETPRSKAPWLIGAFGLLALFGGVFGAYLMTRPAQAEPTTTTSAPAQASTSTDAPPLPTHVADPATDATEDDPLAAPSPPAGETAPTDPRMAATTPSGASVTITVTTNPPHGRVRVSEEQRCRRAPCEFAVQVGEVVELRGRLGRLTGFRRVTVGDQLAFRLPLRERQRGEAADIPPVPRMRTTTQVRVRPAPRPGTMGSLSELRDAPQLQR